MNRLKIIDQVRSLQSGLLCHQCENSSRSDRTASVRGAQHEPGAPYWHSASAPSPLLQRITESAANCKLGPAHARGTLGGTVPYLLMTELEKGITSGRSHPAQYASTRHIHTANAVIRLVKLRAEDVALGVSSRHHVVHTGKDARYSAGSVFRRS